MNTPPVSPPLSSAPACPCRIWAWAGALALLAFVYFFHLSEPVLWGDEADTADFGRNILRFGLPTAYDGRNLLAFENGSQLSQELYSKKIPWVQYYVAAASMQLFGETTFGARFLFAALGVLTLLPLCALLRPLTPYPLAWSLFLLLQPQVVLFARNARYYSVLAFLFVLLLWVFTAAPWPRRWRAGAMLALSILLFHTHPLAAATALGALVLVAWFTQRPDTGPVALAAAGGLGSWGLWYFSLTPIPNPDPSSSLLAHPGLLFSQFVESLRAFILDLDFVNVFPLIATAALLAICLLFRRGPLKTLLHQPLILAILLAAAAQIIAISLLVGPETPDHFAVLRYLPHLVLLLPLPLYLMLELCLGQKPHALLVAAAIFATNAFTLSVWLPSSPGYNWRWSWWPAIYAEIFSPPPDDLAAILHQLDQTPPPSTDSVLFIYPPFLNEIFIFYDGDRWRIRPDFQPGSDFDHLLRRTLGDAAIDRLMADPDALVLNATPPATKPPGYTVTALPLHRPTLDATRPELTRHGFPAPSPTGQMVIQRKDPP